MKKVRFKALSYGFLVMATMAAHADESEGWRRCASVDSDEERLACYDRESGRAGRSEDATEQPAPAPPPVATEDSITTDSGAKTEEKAAATEMPEDFGAEQVKGGESNEQDRTAWATVTSCEKDGYNKYYFFLDNGQVWKQIDSDRLRVKGCDFRILITRDAFGYKLQIDGKGQRTRVQRVR